MRYRFAEFDLDTERLEFRADGKVRALEPQVFDVLRYLVENADRLVGRDELIEAVWGGRIVSDATISARINAVRKAVGDSGERQALIKTVPRRGFRFVAPVLAGDEGPALASGVAVAGEGRGMALPAQPSIAVLPFKNLSDDPDQEFLADGLAEDIITALSKLSEMFVIARNSTFAYKGRSPDVRQVASELGVCTVLEGGIRRSGERIRITARLVETETGRHLWAERYDRRVSDIFDLQDEITQEIVTALEVRLTKGEQARLRRRQTNNLEAWDLYVRGLARLTHFTREDNIMAREFAQRAIELDRGFAAPWSLLAWTHLADARVGWGESNATSRELGVEAALAGLAIDENDADAHGMLGALRVLQRRYDEADEEGRRSIALAPSAADLYVFYAVSLNFLGRAEEAVTMIEKAMRLSPFYPDWYLGIIGQSYRLLGRFDAAIAVDDERLARNPDNAFSDVRLAAVHSELGRDDEARFHVREARRKNPNISLRQVRDMDPYRDEATMQRYLDLLRKAGLPE